MADMALFNDDAFSMTALTASINELETTPSRLAALGLFEEEGMTVTTAQIERDGEQLQLVASAERGSPGQVVVGSKRQVIPFNAVHLPEIATIKADEVQNLRAFGEETELEALCDALGSIGLDVVLLGRGYDPAGEPEGAEPYLSA